MYLLHPKFAKDPRHYVRAFLLLQGDLQDLFAFVEPADENLRTYSHRIQQLLMRACIEVEANLTAILVENRYQKASGNLTMTDYRLVNASHRLSAYEVRIPEWKGSLGSRRPFASWEQGDSSLSWYKAYNKSKHDRHESFRLATFNSLIDAMCGLVVVLSSQFFDEDYSSVAKSLNISSDYSYGTDDGMNSAIGGYFRVAFPSDWPEDDCYDFDWGALKGLDDPFDEFDHAGAA